MDSGRYLQKVFPILGIRFISINDNYDSLGVNHQANDFVIPIKNFINDSHCKDLSVKIRSNLDVKRRKGEYVGAYTPYGYMKDPQDKNKLIVDEKAGETVKQIFSLYKDGKSIGQIADYLNNIGIPSPMEHKISSGINFETSFKTSEKAKWSYNAVRRILTNEAYIGILAQGKRGTPNYKVHVIQKRDERDWICVEDALPALVTYDDFMSVKNMLGRDVRIVSADAEANPLSGFLFCGDCGQPMVRKTVPSKKKKYYYFVCSTNKRHEGCIPHNMSLKELTRTVKNAIASHINHILDLSKTLEYIEKLPSANRLILDYETQIENMEREIERLHKMKLRIYEDLTNGILDKQEYADFRQQYKMQIEEKSNSLERLRREKKDAYGDDFEGVPLNSHDGALYIYTRDHKIKRYISAYSGYFCNNGKDYYLQKSSDSQGSVDIDIGDDNKGCEIKCIGAGYNAYRGAGIEVTRTKSDGEAVTGKYSYGSKNANAVVYSQGAKYWDAKSVSTVTNSFSSEAYPERNYTNTETITRVAYEYSSFKDLVFVTNMIF